MSDGNGSHSGGSRSARRSSLLLGALYAFAAVGPLIERLDLDSSAALARRLLDEHGLACVPGSAFGARGERMLRLSFAVAPDQLGDATDRLAACVRSARTPPAVTPSAS